MGDKQNRGYGAAIRRGVALGLVLVGLWGISLTVDLSQVGKSIAQLGSKPAVAVSLLASQLGGQSQQREQGLSGWGRLLFFQSPLLRSGEAGVLALRQGGQTEQDPESSDHNGDGDDQEQPDLTPQVGEDGIVETTSKGKNEGKYLFGQGVYVYNRTDLDLDVSVLTAGTVRVPLGEGPQILIVHTHGSESYAQSDGDHYEESDPYRTTDCTHNVVKVGEEMATVFRAYGFQVLHDTTLFDYPSYNGAYDRSKAAVEQWLKEYPTIKIVLDVHRDALVGTEGQVYKLVSQEAGNKVAQVMLVVGSSGSGAEHGGWKDNLAFAVKLQQSLTRGYDNLARPIVLRNSRYNQQLLPGSLLVEVGGHGNTLSEAIAGGRLWADNVARTLLEMKEQS